MKSRSVITPNVAALLITHLSMWERVFSHHDSHAHYSESESGFVYQRAST